MTATHASTRITITLTKRQFFLSQSNGGFVKTEALKLANEVGIQRIIHHLDFKNRVPYNNLILQKSKSRTGFYPLGLVQPQTSQIEAEK